VSDVTLGITANDPESSVAHIDYVVTDPPGGAGVWSGSEASDAVTLAISAEGTTTVEYSAVNGAGSRSATETAQVRLDRTVPLDPALTSPSHTAGAYSDVDTIQIELDGAWDGISGVDGYSVSWSEGATESPDAVKDLEVSETSVTSAALPDGAWYVNVRTVDAAGNWTSTAHEGPFRIETQAPVATDDAPTEWRKDDVALTIAATDASGIARIDYVVTDPPPGGAWSGGSDSDTVVLDVTEEGITTVEYSALDVAGSRSVTGTAIVRVDKTAPVSSADVDASYAGNATIELEAADDGGSSLAGTYYTVDGGARQTYAGPFDVSGLGDHRIAYWSVDRAGNEEAAKEAAFRVISGGTTYLDVEGQTRYETAIAASQEAFPRGADVVIVATGENWPDALGGAALAGAWDAPILLTPAASLPAAVASEIERLGVADAIILGGTGAVSTTVSNQLLAQLGAGNVFRLGGATRYDTADLVARAVANKLGGSYDGTAFVTTGLNFPDALAGSPLAAAGPWPILLAPDTGLTAATQQVAGDIGVSEVLILGGEGVVTPATMAALEAEYGAGNVERLAGPTRYETAWEVARHGVEEAGLAWSGLALATGENFPDALSGGALQGQSGSIMALTLTVQLPPVVADGLAEERDSIEQVRFLGGTGAVSQAVRDEVRGILR
jgi:putative cell wall-binding protein